MLIGQKATVPGIQIQSQGFKAMPLATAKITSFCGVFIMAVEHWIHTEKILLANKHVEIIPFPITIMIIPGPTHIFIYLPLQLLGISLRRD